MLINQRHIGDAPIDQVLIHSYESNHYVVDIVLGGATHNLAGTDGAIRVFDSMDSIKELFKDVQVDQAKMMWRDVQDEMVGTSIDANVDEGIPVQLKEV